MAFGQSKRYSGWIWIMYGLGIAGLGIGPGCADSAPSKAQKAPAAGIKGKKSTAGAIKAAAPVDIFTDDAVYHYAITVDPDDWALINRFPVREQYIRGKLEFEGRTYEPIALRFKGARGSLYGCFKCCSTSDTLADCPGPDQACYDDNGMVAPDTCSKLSMKIDFDNDWGKTDFYGIDRLNVHAPQFEPVGLRERLSYWIFRDFDIKAPRATSATVSVNGQELGVFTMIEAESSSFVVDAFGDSEPGNLYKQRWPTLSSDPDYYASGLETNKKNPDVSRMLEASAALASATDETILSVLEERFDLDALMRFLAVDRAIGNFDGPLTFRCKDHDTIPALPPDVLAAQVFPLPWETCQNKNYYFYEKPEDGRLYLVPWDLNLTLFPFPGMSWTAPPKDCDKLQWNTRVPQCDPLVHWLATVTYSRFIDAGQQLLQTSFDFDRMSAQLDVWTASLAPAALVHQGLSAAQLTSSTNYLKSTLQVEVDDFASSLAPAPSTPAPSTP